MPDREAVTEPPGGEARAAQACERRRRGFQALALARLPGPVHSSLTQAVGEQNLLARPIVAAPVEHAQSDAMLGLFVVERLAGIEGNELVLAAAGGEGQRVEDVIAVAAAVLGGRSQEQALLPLGQAAPWFGRVVGE
jgi:hypothetical protein